MLANILGYHREWEHLTQADLARKAGVHPTTISKIEDGERGISMSTLAKMAVPLGGLFVSQVLRYYRNGPDDFGPDYHVSPDSRRSTGGLISESSVPVEQPDAEKAEGGDGAGS